MVTARDADEHRQAPVELSAHSIQKLELRGRLDGEAPRQLRRGGKLAHEVGIFVDARDNKLRGIHVARLADAILTGGAHLEPLHKGCDHGDDEGIGLNSETELGARPQSALERVDTHAKLSGIKEVERCAKLLGQGIELLGGHESSF